jgi:hypothetical protein
VDWTKGDLVNAAFEELTLAEGDGFGITPDEEARALKRMDAMVATWAAKGVRIGYAFPSSPSASKLTDLAGIPDSAAETIFLNLAKRMAPGYGKQLNPETVAAARDGYDTLLWAAAMPPEQQLPHTMARGAGAKPWRTSNRPFLPRPDTDPLRNNDSGDLTILQE